MLVSDATGLSPALPPVSPLLYLLATNGHSPDLPLREWASVIGIVTAIIGNVLISFALNIQRYAHIRIAQDHHETKRAWRKRGKQSPNRHRDYGTAEQVEIAEERARLNATAPGPGQRQETANTGGSEDGTEETVPFKGSFESESTLKSSETDEDDDNDSRESYLKSPYWWAGIILMTIGEAGNFLAYGFAPASIVSPLGVVALISNCVIAPIMLKERFRQRDFWGVIVAIGGAVTVVLSAKQNETKMGPNDLWDAVRRWEFLTYVGITTLVIILLMIASPKYGSSSILINLGLVGLFGGYTALSTKGVASLLSDTLFRALTFPITYVMVFVLITSALMQIRYLNRALQNFDSTQVIPTQFVLFTLSVIIGSAVLYRDFEAATAERVGKFIGGCLLTFFGVYLITSGRPRRDEEYDDDESEQEGIRLIDEEANYHDERTPLQDGNVDIRISQPEQKGLRPVTPDQKGSLHPSKGSSKTPSLSVTPDPATASTSFNPHENPWRPSADIDDDGIPLPVSAQPDLFKTPQLSRIQQDTEATPYFTPPSAIAPQPALKSMLNRTSSGPADPQTPTRSSKRTPSPPKADRPARPPPSPHSHSRSTRGSIGRLLPGPLMPTLSSSLSAVVADSLLRGEGSPRMHSLRRNRSQRNESTSFNGTPTASGSANVSRQSLTTSEIGQLSRSNTRETEPDPDVQEIFESDDAMAKKKSRLRAMSDSLSGLIAGPRSKRNSRRRDQGDERGPDENSGAGARPAVGAVMSAEAPT